MASPRRPVVTMKHVAARAGVSVMTVSLALRNHPDVAAATKNKIHRLAAEMGYRRDPMLAALVQHRRGLRAPAYRETVAYLHPAWSAELKRRLLAPGGLLAGLRRRAEQLGYRVEPFALAPDPAEARRLARTLSARGVRGLVLDASLREAEPALAGFDWSGFACVVVHNQRAFTEHHRVFANHFVNMQQALRRCEALGYRRPGFWLPRENFLHRGQRWLGAFMQHWLLTHPDETPPLHIEPYTPAAFARWLADAAPDCVITSNLGGAFVRQAFASAGRRPGRRLGYCDLSVPAADSDITGIFQHSADIGETALDIVVGSLERNELGPPRIPMSVGIVGEWVPGSTAPGPKGSGVTPRP
jgi:DNA-binding LacI/PurR family transcriptional regulator